MRQFVLSFFLLIVIAPQSVSEELFQDLSLRHGFNLSAVTSRSKPLALGPILQRESDSPPLWRLAQWGTNHNLLGTKEIHHKNGTLVLENEGKRIEVRSGGLAGEGVTLTVLGGAEYGGKLRKKGEPWPHLLVEQRMPDSLRVADYARLDFQLDFRVVRCDLAGSAVVERRLHTGQITAFFAVHNRNKKSTDFNDMIWFGLPIFDVRHDFPPGHQAVDGGKSTATGKFICTLPGKRFYDRSTGDGTWHALRGELVSLLREALAASQAKGFLTDTEFEDLQPTSFNLGWEVPGPYDCAITLKGLGLDGQRRISAP
jgi:hypothetical protein